ncbi:MAG: glycosyltransferase [Phycisphaerales bacterium]|nr:glycosyltransferase [Phycisphaerales bacterium]
MKKVLIVAPQAYPPKRGPGGLRALGFSRHLAEFGWEPTVLVLDDRFLGSSCDPSLRDRIPKHVNVVKVFSPEHFLSAAIHQTMQFVRRSNKSGATEASQSASPSEKSTHRNALSMFARRVAKNFFGDDFYPGWMTATVLAGIPIARESDCIYSTSPPFGSHIVAKWISRLTRVPWVADFRDPYAAGAYHLRTKGANDAAGEARAIRRERGVLAAADAVITVTDAMDEIYKSHYPEIPAAKLHVITNGYDEDIELRTIESSLDESPKPGSTKLRIVHAGLIYNVNVLASLCEAINILIREKKATKADFEIELIGNCPSEHHAVFKEQTLSECLVAPGIVPQKEAFRRMCLADALLIEAGATIAHYAIRAKIFEYMLARRPVLGILEEGPMAKLIRDTRIGYCVPASEPKKIAEILERLVVAKKSGTLAELIADAEFAKYNRRLLTQDLSRIFDSIVRK